MTDAAGDTEGSFAARRCDDPAAAGYEVASVTDGGRRSEDGLVRERGDVFGLAAVVEQMRRRVFTVECLEDTTVCAINGARLREILKMDPATGYAVMQRFAGLMAKAVLLLATEPLDRVTGRVTYSQQILLEFGWIEKGRGIGVDFPGSGYSQA